MPRTRPVRLFLASPNDVAPERDRIEEVVKRYNATRTDRPRIDLYRWENEVFRANRTYQIQIDDPANADIVVVVFGGRLGSELPPEFRRRLPNGEPYPSGTAYELLSAMAAADLRGWPDIYVYRKRAAADQDPEEAARLGAFFERWFRRRALPVQEFLDAGDIEGKIEGLLETWMANPPRPALQWRDDEKSPFRGLEPFDARHAAVYFGRDRKVERALEALLRASTAETGRPFLLVVGASGSGKSSLVRAGLVRRLIAPNAAPDVDGWRVAVMRPGAKPIDALVQALFFAPEDDKADPGGFGKALPELARGERATPADLAAAILDKPADSAGPLVAALDRAGLRRDAQRDRIDLLLVVDQLEEIFDASVDTAEQAAFAAALEAFCATRRIWVAATLRVDLYGRMIEAGTAWLRLKDSGGHYDLASPGPEEIKEIIDRSADAAGLTYEKDPKSGERLDERLFEDATGSSDVLPLLEYSLAELFRRKRTIEDGKASRVELTYEAYHKFGGIFGVIEETAKRALADKKFHLEEAEINRALPPLLRALAATRVSDDGAATSGRTRVTARAAPLAAVAKDAASRKLIEALLQARLLVSLDETSSGAGGAIRPEPKLRVAHERVLTSWSRARAIVEKYAAYFDDRANLEQRYLLWRRRGERREDLLPAGKPLADAEALAQEFREDLQSQGRGGDDKRRRTLLDYVEISGRAVRFWQRLGYLAASVFFVVALIATAMAIVAFNAEQSAERNYNAAKGGADRLITLLAEDLRVQKGVATHTIDDAFKTVDELLTKLADTVASGDSARLLSRGAQWIATRMLGAADPIRAALGLETSRAKLFYDFALTYHQAGQTWRPAMEKAKNGLELLNDLNRRGVRGPDIDDLTAKDYTEIGDLERKRTEESLPLHQKPDFSAARRNYQEAEKLLEPLLRSPAASADWIADGSKLETKLGDIENKEGNRDTARKHYDTAQTYAWRLVKAQPEDLQAQTELAWSFRKLGETRADPALAAADFEKEVCVRRHSRDTFKDNKEPPRGLSYALAKLARARERVPAPDLEAASDAAKEALLVIVSLVDDDQDQLNFQQTRDSLKLIAEILRKAKDDAQADAFEKSAKSVEYKTNEAFAPLPATGAEQKLADELEQRRRGVRAMMGDERPLIENVLQNFESGRLDKILEAENDCWERIGEPSSMASLRRPTAH